jgi:hypothetical protein
VLAVLNWVAVGLFLAALVPSVLGWAGRVRFDRWLPPEQSRPAGRAFALLDAGALLQAVAQLFDGVTRWAVSSPGLVLVVVGAVLVLRLRRSSVSSSSGAPGRPE